MNKNMIKVNKHSYIYSDKFKTFNFIPVVKENIEKNQLFDYENRYFWDNYNYFESSPINFQTQYSSDKIKINLANLRQLLIEVTDSCNLQCKYCGYGDLYANYDKRESKLQQFSNVKLLIAHLTKLWCSEYNTSFNKEIVIGFYGGEPLMNIHLIKEIIAYLESLQNIKVSFSYNMTTNSILLDKYMDFLVEKKFKLLLSLDGNEYNSGYRINKQGGGSFQKVFSNIKLLQSTYPDFFDKNVNFNAVLHNRNSVEDIFTFIKHEFNKIPRIAELNTNGLSDKGKEEFNQMFNSRFNSFDMSSENFKSQEDVLQEDSISTFYHMFIRDFSGNYFNTYTDLFDSVDTTTYIPTGTCRPFERKLYFTVNGKIIPCEKIGQNHVLGNVTGGALYLNYDKVDTYYHDKYEKIINNCKTCFLQKTCGQCMFLLEEKNGEIICQGYIGKNKSTDYFARYLSFAEEHPDLYESLMSNIAID